MAVDRNALLKALQDDSQRDYTARVQPAMPPPGVMPPISQPAPFMMGPVQYPNNKDMQRRENINHYLMSPQRITPNPGNPTQYNQQGQPLMGPFQGSPPNPYDYTGYPVNR